MCISDPTTQAPGCSVRTRSGSQSQVGHVSHAFPRSKTLRVCHVLGVHSLRLAVCLLHFPGPSCSYFWVFYEGPVPVEPCISCFSQEEEAQTPPPRLVLCQGTVPGGFFAFYTSQAQAVQIPGCSMNAQSQLSHASPALPRPKWPGILPEHSPRWALCLMHFPGPSCSGSRMFQSTLFQRATQALRIAVTSQSLEDHLYRALLRFNLVIFSYAPQGYSLWWVVHLLRGVALRLWNSWQLSTVLNFRKPWLAAAHG